MHLLEHLHKKELLPIVVFTFSKKRCEENAGTLTNADLCSWVEKSEVHVAVERALSRLKGSDKKLPQIGRMHELLLRGIGMHHRCLLPIVKELVEILFAWGLVKILFAMEMLPMGVNMPAQSVVFSGIRKHDGCSFREIPYCPRARTSQPTFCMLISRKSMLPLSSPPSSPWTRSSEMSRWRVVMHGAGSGQGSGNYLPFVNPLSRGHIPRCLSLCHFNYHPSTPSNIFILHLVNYYLDRPIIIRFWSIITQSGWICPNPVSLGPHLRSYMWIGVF